MDAVRSQAEPESAAEDARRRSESRVQEELAAVFQALPDGYFRLDADGRVLDHRPGVVGTRLLEGETLVGRALEEICPPEAAAEIRLAMEKVRRERELVRVEYTTPTREGVQNAANPLERQGVIAAMASPRAVSPTARPATLLYIEDNLANLTLVETILDGRPDVTLIPALQGRLGLDLACQHRPDLILLDLHLPDIPGDEVLARLRAQSATRDTPVIVISADATPRRIEQLRDAGVFAYLTKPLDVDEFLDTVDAALDQREA
ncbi:MAG: response regulator [Gemmatimonadota bacterium]